MNMLGLRIASCNVNGLADRCKHRQMFKYFHDKNFDIVCIQETHCTRKWHKIWKSEWGGDIYFSDGESNARGVAILLRRNIVIENVNVNRDKEGRKLQLKFDLKEKSFEICNIYAPNQDDPAFFIDVLNNIQDSEIDFPIICGDLNVYLNELKDVKSFQCNRGQSSSSKVLNAFMDEYEWVDIWRVLYPDIFQLTWKRRGLIQYYVSTGLFFVTP